MDFYNNSINGCGAALCIYKIDSISGIGVPGAVFELTACNGSRRVGVTNVNGSLTFGIALCTSYLLREITPPAGYSAAGTVFNIYADGCGRIFVDGVPTSQLVISNTPIMASFTAIKVNIVNGTPLAGAVYTLFMNATAIASATSDTAGQLTFSNIPPGTYQLVETTPPPGFQINLTQLTVVVAPDGQVTIMGQPANGFLIQDVPLLELLFRKVDASTGLPLAGATFTLTQSSILIGTAISDSNGLVNFGALGAGAYQLTETNAPVGFQPNSTIYQVVVGVDGSITVNGAPLEAFVVEDIPVAISAPPTINMVLEGAPVISGNGIPGSAIAVTLPSGTMVSTTVNAGGSWMVNVPAGITLAIGDIVYANQTEPGKLVSGDVHTIVISSTDVEPGIDIFVENLSTGLNTAQAGDVLLYDAIVTNSGTISSVWQSAYATFSLGNAVTLQVSTLRINNQVVTADQYSYDSVANTLTIYLGDIVGGGGVSISYRVTVNAAIANINEIVLDVILGSLV